MEFNDEELEKYFSLRAKADDYMNMLIRLKRVEEMKK